MPDEDGEYRLGLRTGYLFRPALGIVLAVFFIAMSSLKGWPFQPLWIFGGIACVLELIRRVVVGVDGLEDEADALELDEQPLSDKWRFRRPS